jgi:hypothetical protein
VNRYWIEPLPTYRACVLGVGALFARLRAGAVWVERDHNGNDIRLARRPNQMFPIWTTKETK